jgi:drug/metabolite transporter superfamily protein YnfA
MRTFCLHFATAIAEIIGCYLPYLWLQEGKNVAPVIPAALSLAIFAWLLTLHPSAAGRVCGLWQGLYLRSSALALACRGNAANDLGLRWRGLLASRNGDHRISIASI